MAPGVGADLLQAAFQMHNGPAQYLATALMRLRLCERYISEDVVRAAALLRESIVGVQTALDSVRATIDMLRCSQAKSHSLEWHLHAMVQRLRSTYAAGFDEDMEDIGPLPHALTEGLAEIACEAVTNAVKHACARHITVRLRMKKKKAVILEVMDDGKGFTLAKGLRGREPSGVGLVLMRERARQLGGTLTIKSTCPGGTFVRTVVPISG